MSVSTESKYISVLVVVLVVMSLILLWIMSIKVLAKQSFI